MKRRFYQETSHIFNKKHQKRQKYENQTNQINNAPINLQFKNPNHLILQLTPITKDQKRLSSTVHTARYLIFTTSESAKWRAQHALHALCAHVPYVLYLPYVPKYVLQTGKLKNGNFVPIRF